MTEKEIYEQTQRLARRLAAMDGWEAAAADFRHDSENPVGRRYFAMAAASQEFLCGHDPDIFSQNNS